MTLSVLGHYCITGGQNCITITSLVINNRSMHMDPTERGSHWPGDVATCTFWSYLSVMPSSPVQGSGHTPSELS